MSTRCTINFVEGTHHVAKIYRHSDGYPDGPGVLGDMEKFFSEVERQTADTRFTDASYLAAKFVVWQAELVARRLERSDLDAKKHNLVFLGVGILTKDPSDIEYTYKVDCAKLNEKTGYPTVTYKSVR